MTAQTTNYYRENATFYFNATNKGEYAWECACGECYREAKHAIHCRKCNTYAEGPERHATHVLHGVTLNAEQVEAGHVLTSTPILTLPTFEMFTTAMERFHAAHEC